MTGLSACLPVYSTDAIRRKVVQFAFLLSPPSLKPKTLNIFACRSAGRKELHDFPYLSFPPCPSLCDSITFLSKPHYFLKLPGKKSKGIFPGHRLTIHVKYDIRNIFQTCVPVCCMPVCHIRHGTIRTNAAPTCGHTERYCSCHISGTTSGRSRHHRRASGNNGRSRK